MFNLQKLLYFYTILTYILGFEDYRTTFSFISFNQLPGPYCRSVLIRNDERKETLFENFTVTLQPYTGTQPVLSTNLVIDDTPSFVRIEDDDCKILKIKNYISIYHLNLGILNNIIHSRMH